MTEDQLPSVFAQYGAVVRHVQKDSSVKWTSSCPSCGGDVHQDGELPDRCVWFLNGNPCGWCSKCHTVFWPDSAPGWKPPTPQQLDEWRREREAEEQAHIAKSAQRLEFLRSQHLWTQYADMMDEQARRWWTGRGIPEAYQSFWSLGWEHDTRRWGCQSATIPIFDSGWNVLNIKHRLTDNSKGRYRYHVAGLPAPMFLCDPDADMTGHVIAIEGEIKAAVCHVTLDDPQACIVGIPGLSPSPEIKATLAQAERVTLVLDPGADKPGPDGWSPMGRLVRGIGRERCYVVMPPVKIDDGILAAGLGKREVRQMLGAAMKI